VVIVVMICKEGAHYLPSPDWEHELFQRFLNLQTDYGIVEPRHGGGGTVGQH
jgi:hypothetical protein